MFDVGSGGSELSMPGAFLQIRKGVHAEEGMAESGVLRNFFGRNQHDVHDLEKETELVDLQFVRRWDGVCAWPLATAVHRYAFGCIIPKNSFAS